MKEIMAMTKAFIFLESQDYTFVCAEWLSEHDPKGSDRISKQALAGVQGNERADRLTDLATTNDGHPLDHADSVNVHKEFGRMDTLREVT